MEYTKRKVNKKILDYRKTDCNKLKRILDNTDLKTLLEYNDISKT